MSVRDGEKGPIEIEMITRRVQTRLERKRTGPEEWLVVTRRPLADDSTWEPQASRDACDQDTRYRYRYYLTPKCGAEAGREELSLVELARVIKAGLCIELGFYQFTQPLVPLSRLYGEPWDFFGSFSARSL